MERRMFVSDEHLAGEVRSGRSLGRTEDEGGEL